MRVHVMVSQLEASPSLREWVATRLAEVLGPAVASVLSVAVVLNPVMSSKPSERRVRCAVVITTNQGRRVFETRDEQTQLAIDRAMRLVSLSLFADPPGRPVERERTAPLT